MGLDMYLKRRVHLANYRHDPKGMALSQAVLSALGFFFGSTAIDEDCREDLLATVEGIDRILDPAAEITGCDSFYYRASW